MITIRTKEEIELLREAGKIVAETHDYLKKFIKPGITTKELDKLAYDFIISKGATPSCLGYEGFPATLCTSINDEVVHGKGTILSRMPGDEWQRFANLRAYYSYMFMSPGKKLLFMGDELATYDEWHYEGELAWNIRSFPDHDAAARFVRDMTLVYKYHAPLWQADYSTNGFYWIQADNADQSMYVFARVANDPKDQLIVVMNCTPNTYDNYRIGVPEADEYYEVINSDKDIYGGSNRINPFNLKVENFGQDNQAHSVLMTIPPLGISILKPIYYPKPVEEKKEEVVEEVKEVKKTTAKKTTAAKKATTEKKTTTTKKTTKKA